MEVIEEPDFVIVNPHPENIDLLEELFFINNEQLNDIIDSSIVIIKHNEKIN